MSRTPPVPPANRSPKGPQNEGRQDRSPDRETAPDSAPASKNLELQGQEGNIHQNTPRRATRLER